MSGDRKKMSREQVKEMLQEYLVDVMRSGDVLREPQAVVDWARVSLAYRDREVFVVMFLNKANALIKAEEMFQGTVDECAVHVREVVRGALLCNATAVILVHNHPSGRTEASAEDRAITEKIRVGLDTVGIKTLDHVIVGGDKHYSFREGGLLG